MAGWTLATHVGACGAVLAADVYPRAGIAGFGTGLLCGSLSTDTDVRGALSFRTAMAQYSQRRLRRPGGHIMIHHLTSEHGQLHGVDVLGHWQQGVGVTRGPWGEATVVQ